jgi:hypothetical protein
MKLMRAFLAGVGTFCDVLIPPKVLAENRSRAYESRGDSPEAVSTGHRPPEPASGHSADEAALEFAWEHWAIPSIVSVFTTHIPGSVVGDPYVYCTDPEGRRHAKFEDWPDWCDDMARRIAHSIHSAAMAEK